MDQIYDVAVIGAGPSGIAAAIYAAKYGAKTALIEKDSIIGGTAFKAYVHTLNGQSLSAMDGLLDGITKKAWGSIIFQPEDLLDKYYSSLEKYPVDLLCGYEVISAETKDGKITSLICLSHSEKIAISAKTIIDASGALAIENLTGTKDSGIPAYCYMTGLIGKVETVGGKCYSAEAKKLLEETISNSKQNGKLSPNLFIQIQPTVRADIALIIIKHENSGDDTGILMRSLMTEAIDFMQTFGYGFENASLISSSKDIFYSALGSFNAKHTLTLEEVSQNKYFNDQIAALPDDDGDDERIYYIPYSSLLSARFDNLLLCGRNIGAATNAIMQIDAIPTHFETGKAAGIAAAIAEKNEIALQNVSPYEIVSKTQESVSDKIEIINETIGLEKAESESFVNLNIISEPENEHERLTQNFTLSPPLESESFAELDKALSFIGEETLAVPKQEQDANSFFEDIDSVMDIDHESIVKKPVPEEDSAEDVIRKMAGFTNVSQNYSSENEAFVAPNENIIDLTEEYIEEDTAVETEDFASTSYKFKDIEYSMPPSEISDKSAVSHEQESDDAIQYALQKQLIDEIQHASRNEKPEEFEDIEAFIAPLETQHEILEVQEPESADSIQDALQNQPIDEMQNDPQAKTPEEFSDIEAFIPPLEPHRETAKLQEPESQDVLLNTQQSQLTVEIQHASQNQEPEITKEITSSDDVLSLLYNQSDEFDSANDKANNTPIENIAQDEISLLYDNTENKNESAPKKHGKKDNVSSLLDMIYDITDSKEEDISVHEVISSKNDKSAESPNKEEKNPPISNDKFKAIKDFLYDDDE